MVLMGRMLIWVEKCLCEIIGFIQVGESFVFDTATLNSHFSFIIVQYLHHSRVHELGLISMKTIVFH